MHTSYASKGSIYCELCSLCEIIDDTLEALGVYMVGKTVIGTNKSINNAAAATYTGDIFMGKLPYIHIVKETWFKYHMHNLLKAYTNDIEKNKWQYCVVVKEQEESSIAIHEAWHVIESLIEQVYINVSIPEVDKAFSIYGQRSFVAYNKVRKETEDVQRAVLPSRYAGTNEREMHAECFVEWMLKAKTEWHPMTIILDTYFEAYVDILPIVQQYLNNEYRKIKGGV